MPAYSSGGIPGGLPAKSVGDASHRWQLAPIGSRILRSQHRLPGPGFTEPLQHVVGRHHASRRRVRFPLALPAGRSVLPALSRACLRRHPRFMGRLPENQPAPNRQARIKHVFRPPTSDLRPPTSDLRPPGRPQGCAPTDLRPPTSDLRPCPPPVPSPATPSF